jgi:hypothetical protein
VDKNAAIEGRGVAVIDVQLVDDRVTEDLMIMAPRPNVKY